MATRKSGPQPGDVVTDTTYRLDDGTLSTTVPPGQSAVVVAAAGTALPPDEAA